MPFILPNLNKPDKKRKLTMTQAEEIRYKYANGVTQVALAAKYNVSRATISAIIAKRTYCKPLKGA